MGSSKPSLSRHRTLAVLASICLCLIGQGHRPARGQDQQAVSKKVVAHYATLVHVTYADAHREAVRLKQAVYKFTSAPTAEGLEAAKKAWINARIPYLQTEAFRFYEGPIDDEDGPEGLLNAWPMDEAYLDGVVGAPNSGIINRRDAYPVISAAGLQKWNEKDGETNIATGYHAVEFLLWGQDLSADGPGKRPFTDYTTARNAKRRGVCLRAATDLIVTHLKSLVDEWSPKSESNYRASFVADDPDASAKKILTGLSMLTGFEMASERLLVAYDTQEQEDEHSCFSDTTHLDILYDLIGIRNVWSCNYKRPDGGVFKGTGFGALVKQADASLAAKLEKKINEGIAQAKAIPAPFDQAILGDDSKPSRKSILRLIETLEEQAELMVKAGKALGFEVPIAE